MTPLKCLLLLLFLVAVTAGLGVVGCWTSGVGTRPYEMLLACGLALAAAMLAAAPALWQRGKLDTPGMFQAAFIGTVLHLGLVLILGLVLLMMARLTTPFVLWLLGAYWATLIGLCITFAKLIHSAPKSAKR